MKKTFSELKKELDNDGLSSIPDINGYYTVFLPEAFEIRLKGDTEAINSYIKKGEKICLVYPLEKLINKLETVRRIQDKKDRKILYIGKAEGKRGLQQRITEFVRYSYGLCENHRGGRALWQIENNKSLLLDFTICENAEKEEKRLLQNFKLRYHTYPFANWRL